MANAVRTGLTWAAQTVLPTVRPAQPATQVIS